MKVADVAIIGSGPAGISAALNLKLHNKQIIWFGAKDLSLKVGKAELIANYPGMPMTSGEELNQAFLKQIEAAKLQITDQLVTMINTASDGFMLLADNDVYEARAVLLATGAMGQHPLLGEEALLGKGVSYCATCDGFFYRGKTIAVLCGAKRFEHEVEYLAELAEKIYLTVSYQDCEIDLPNVERITSPIKAIQGTDRVERVRFGNGEERAVDGVFLLRSAIAPTMLINGIEMEGAHIVVDRQMKTSIPGVFAAGDCVGLPYQIAKSVGEGNVAAHGIIEYLASST